MNLARRRIRLTGNAVKFMVLLLVWVQKLPTAPQQAGIEFKKNLRVRFGNYGGLKLEYFWVVKSKKAKSFIRG